VNWLFAAQHDSAVAKIQIVRKLDNGQESVLKTVENTALRSTYLKNLKSGKVYRLFIRVIYNDGTRVDGDVSSVTTRR
jgi:hypothetical protein